MNQSIIDGLVYRHLSEEQKSEFKKFLDDNGLVPNAENVAYNGTILQHKYSFACGWDAARINFLQKVEKELERQEKRETTTDWEESNRIGKINALEDILEELRKIS